MGREMSVHRAEAAHSRIRGLRAANGETTGKCTVGRHLWEASATGRGIPGRCPCAPAARAHYATADRYQASEAFLTSCRRWPCMPSALQTDRGLKSLLK